MEVRDALFDCAHWPGGPVAVQDGRDDARPDAALLEQLHDLLYALRVAELRLLKDVAQALVVNIGGFGALELGQHGGYGAQHRHELPSQIIPAPSAGN